MKRFLIPLLAALVLPTAVNANWYEKYSSFKEAKKTCDEWVKKKGSVIATPYIEGSWVNINEPLRRCTHEEKTNQIIGLEFANIKDKYYTDEQWQLIKYPYQKKVKKRFKYYKKNLSSADIQSDFWRLRNNQIDERKKKILACFELDKKIQFAKLGGKHEGWNYYINPNNLKITRVYSTCEPTSFRDSSPKYVGVLNASYKQNNQEYVYKVEDWYLVKYTKYIDAKNNSYTIKRKKLGSLPYSFDQKRGCNIKLDLIQILKKCQYSVLFPPYGYKDREIPAHWHLYYLKNPEEL